MKRLDKVLLIYSTLLAVALTVSSLVSGLTTQNLIMIALFLPVTGYFVYYLIRAYYRHKYFKEQVRTLHAKKPSVRFSFKQFLTQRDLAFLITLCLYFSLIIALAVKAVTTL